MRAYGETEPSRRYGWYSETQRASIRQNNKWMIPPRPAEIHVYCRFDGDHVEVTEVTSTPEPSGLWNDYEPRGEVVRWVRNVPA